MHRLSWQLLNLHLRRKLGTASYSKQNRRELSGYVISNPLCLQSCGPSLSVIRSKLLRGYDGQFCPQIAFYDYELTLSILASRLQLFLSDANWLNTDKAWTKDPAKGPIDYFKLSLNFVSPLHRRRLCLTLAFDLEDSWGLWCRGAGGVRDKEGRKST